MATKTNYLVRVIDRNYNQVINEYNIRSVSAKNALKIARRRNIWAGVDFDIYMDLGDTLELRLSRIEGENVFIHPYEE